MTTQTIQGKFATTLTRFNMRQLKNQKPAIVRTNRHKDRGWSIVQGKRFVAVNMGKKVEYYGADVFHSLYRVTSIPGTLDYTIRPIKTKAKRA